MTDDFLENMSEEQKALASRVFNLVVNRVVKRAYSTFDEKNKEAIDEIFATGDDKEKEKFIKKNIPDLGGLFAEEHKKIEDELRADVEKTLEQ